MTKFNFKKKLKKIPRKILNWDNYQRNIFKDSAEGEGNTAVEAVPGSGKSTSIVECIYNVPAYHRMAGEVMGVAFSNDIVTHLERNVPEGVHVKTCHKIGFQPTLQHWGPTYGLTNRSVDDRGLIAEFLALEEIGNSDKGLRLRKNLIRAMDLAKTTLALSVEEIDLMTLDHGIDTCGLSGSGFAQHVLNMMEKTKEPQKINGRPMISFSDMLWLPYVFGWQPKQYRDVFVDEYQDLSNARFDLVLKSLAKDGRIFVFGDRMQRIFQFAGADTNIVERVNKELSAKKLKLSVSYRLPKSVIDIAKRYNPDIEAAPNAGDGNVSNISKEDIINNVKPGTAILSRTNFHIIELIFSLLKEGIKANIRGKDIADRFLWRISCWEPGTVEELEKSISSWKDTTCELLEDKGRPTERIIDEAESLLRLSSGCSSVSEVQKRIRTFFKDDGKNQVTLSTCHKAKGLEWDNVVLLDNTFKPDKNEEEKCIYYVAITRAKENLIFAR